MWAWLHLKALAFPFLALPTSSCLVGKASHFGVGFSLSGAGFARPSLNHGPAHQPQADPETQHLIIGADTIVAMEGQIMGKPCDREDALRMLTRLNGREHSVITGVAIILTGGAGTRDTEVVVVFHEETLVTFSKLSDELVQEHVEGGEPWDKAGGYGLQARGGAIMAEAVRGDPLNAAGLPLNRLCRELGRRLLPLGPGQEVESQT